MAGGNRLNLTATMKDAASGPLAKIRGSADKLGDSAVRSSGKLSRMGDTLKNVGKIALFGLAGLAVGAAAALPGLVNLAGRLELMGKKAKTVFGDQLGLVERWADKSASAMGLTSRGAVGLAANFADLLIPMEFTREQAAKMATEVVGLSGALSLWSGGTRTAAEVSDILAKAMLGEREGLKELGISINEADVQARLLKNGTDKLTGAQLQQARATATQQLIFEKSKDAQSAYAKSTQGLAGMQMNLKARFDSLVETIAIAVTPALTQLFTWIMDELIPSLKELAPAAAWVGTVFRVNVLPFLRNTVQEVKDLIQMIKSAIAWLGRLIRDTNRWLNIKPGQAGALPKSIANDWQDFLRDAFRGTLRFHTGGVVPGRPGSEMLTVLQAGERVIPARGAGMAGGGGVTLVFNSTWPISPSAAREVTDVVDRELSYRTRSQPR